MTQQNKSAHKNLKNLEKGKTRKNFASTLPAQTLCWLGSFSLLGSGFVVAQMENSGIDNIVPTVDSYQPPAASNSSNSGKQQTLVIEAEKPQPDFSERRVRLTKRLKSKAVSSERQKISKSKAENSQPVVRISKSKAENSQPVVRISKSKVENSQPVVRISKSKAENSQPVVRISKSKTETSQSVVNVAKPKTENSQPVVEFKVPQKIEENINQPVGNSISENNTVPEKNVEIISPERDVDETVRNMGSSREDYNNSSIDPTNYDNLATGNYEPPNSLEITERSSGCQKNLALGENVGSGCGQTFANPNVAADGEKKATPTWLKKSATAKLPTISPNRTLIKENISENNQKEIRESKTVAEAVANGVSKISRSNWRASRVSGNGHSKSSYQPSNYIPSPNEFSASTKVSATPIAPRVGSLPSPMTEEQVAPRLSQANYDFALASVLPQVSYTNTIAYRSGSGMIFPLSVPAPITSLFGWRIHPITGDRRFHAGTDIGAPTGTPVVAAARGQIESANWMGGYGLAVTINHTSAQQTLYGHLSEILVQPGQWVEPGTVIGRVGSTGNSTGPHLHFEVRHLTQNGWVAVDPDIRLQNSLSQVVQSLPPVKRPLQ